MQTKFISVIKKLSETADIKLLEEDIIKLSSSSLKRFNQSANLGNFSTVELGEYLHQKINEWGSRGKHRIAIYGAGEFTERILLEAPNLKPIGIFDRDASKWGTRVRNILVLDPARIKELNPDVTIIGSMFYGEDIAADLALAFKENEIQCLLFDLFADLPNDIAAKLWFDLYGEVVVK